VQVQDIKNSSFCTICISKSRTRYKNTLCYVNGLAFLKKGTKIGHKGTAVC
jgi:hypothetical protein